MKKYLGGIIIGIILLSILRLILNNMEINEQNENRNTTLQKCVEDNFSNEECKKLISDFKKYLEKNDIKSQ
tara:strand:- start:531 stop:743 length:213 start_codon:yes stop_codon:yes gene_type:complete